MKSVLHLLILALLLGVASCKKEADVVNPNQSGDPGTQTPSGAVTPVATPEGSVITATIGPGGGTIESADKRIQVAIPAGALTASQTISLQPLSRNHCPLGTGQGFRLAPHGLTFAKPATITFHYNQQDISGSAPELLRVAYQTDNGFWQSPSTKGIDTTAHTVAVQTTHFSDWGLFQTMHVSPRESFLNPGESVHMNVYQTFTEVVQTPEDELFVPLPTRIPAKYIEKWTLQGEGTLAHQHNEGDYYAPAKIPAINPATVTVFLNKSATIGGQVFKDLRLVANFYVAPEGISFQVGQDDWQTFQGGANINSTNNIIAGRSGNEHVQIGWAGAPTGTYRWTAGTDVAFLYVNGTFFRSQMYFKTVSGGILRTNNEHPEWVVGTFTLTNAGWYDTAPIPPIHGTTSIKGVFRVKRV